MILSNLQLLKNLVSKVLNSSLDELSMFNDLSDMDWWHKRVILVICHGRCTYPGDIHEHVCV